MATLITDSHLRCVHCGKRMMVELGQVDDETVVLLERHTCWDCGSTLLQRHQPARGVLDGTTFMERIRDKVRAG